MENDIYGGAECKSIFRGNLVNRIIINTISTDIHHHFIVY